MDFLSSRFSLNLNLRFSLLDCLRTRVRFNLGLSLWLGEERKLNIDILALKSFLQDRNGRAQ